MDNFDPERVAYMYSDRVRRALKGWQDGANSRAASPAADTVVTPIPHADKPIFHACLEELEETLADFDVRTITVSSLRGGDNELMLVLSHRRVTIDTVVGCTDDKPRPNNIKTVWFNQ